MKNTIAEQNKQSYLSLTLFSKICIFNSEL